MFPKLVHIPLITFSSSTMVPFSLLPEIVVVITREKQGKSGLSHLVWARGEKKKVVLILKISALSLVC